ncbi:MAG: S-layer homology domain-containing protein [Desulfotomaculum sp.]|nr:S-layer homology domain-containing protein [Desulfotomaculum sp.]
MKKVLVLMIFLIALLMMTTAAGAENLTQGDLLKLLPGKDAAGKLTRADYAVMLSRAAGLNEASEVKLPLDVPEDAWYADSIKSLMADGILYGYPDGTVKPEKEITRVEAVVMLSRVLGLPVVPAENVEIKGLEKHAWAAGPYTWCVKEGFLAADKDPAGVITAQEADKLLVGAFATDQLGNEINTRMTQAMKEVKSMRLEGTMGMTVELTPEAVKEIPPELKNNMEFSAKLNSEINMKQGMYQEVTLQMPKVDKMQIEDVVMKQYYTPEGMFVRINNPSTGESEWIKYPEGMLPDFETLVSQQNNMVPEDMQQFFHYRLLNEVKIDNDDYYELAFYGRINDFNKFLQFLNQSMPGNAKQQFNESSGLIKSVSFMGTTMLNKESYLPLWVKTKSVVVFNSNFNNQTLPFRAMKYNYMINYSDFNEEISIELPEEAKQAEEFPVEEN